MQCNLCEMQCSGGNVHLSEWSRIQQGHIVCIEELDETVNVIVVEIII